MKKVIALLLVIALTAALSVSLTMAYLNDTDEDVNVMTLGNVYIDQIEQQWNADKTELVDFDQGKPLYPYVGTLGWENLPTTYATTDSVLNNAAYRRFTMENVVDKYVSVKNVGDSSAYVRTIFAFEMGAFETIDEFKYNVVGYSYNAADGDSFDFPGAWQWGEEFVAQIDGKNYMIREAVHVDALAPEATTIPSLLQVYMNSDCGNDEVEKIDGNGNGTYDILAVSQAVQTKGFKDAQTALDTAFGETDKDNHPWTNGVIIPTYVTSVEGLRDAIAKGGSITLANDITVPENESILIPRGTTVTLDLNGKQIVGNSKYAIRNEGDLAVIGDGAVIGAFGAISTFGELTINSGSFKATGAAGKTHHCVYVGVGGNVVINGGTFEHSGAGISDSGATITVYDYNDNDICDATLVINGGTFIGSGTYIKAFDKYDTESSLTIIGGTFSTNPSKYVPSTCEVTENADGTYTVKGKVIETAEELKDFLTNAGSAGAGDTVLELTNDIDLTGQAWTPINVDGYHGADIVTINGNGHTIKGLSAPLFAGGFAGGSGIVINNLTIADSNIVSTNTIGSGAFIESVDSMDTITLTNCHLKNSTVTGGDGSRTGGLIGWTAGYNNVNDGPVKTYVTIENCSVVDCTITCNGSVGGIYGHAGNNAWTYSTVKNCTVTGCKLNSTDDGDWRTGVVVGTANVGEMTISNITASGNTLTQTGKTAPESQINLYGRFVPGTTGKLVIDGVEIN